MRTIMMHLSLNDRFTTHQTFTDISVYLKKNALYYTYTSLYMTLNRGNIGLVELHLELFCLFCNFFTINIKTGTKYLIKNILKYDYIFFITLLLEIIFSF